MPFKSKYFETKGLIASGCNYFLSYCDFRLQHWSNSNSELSAWNCITKDVEYCCFICGEDLNWIKSFQNMLTERENWTQDIRNGMLFLCKRNCLGARVFLIKYFLRNGICCWINCYFYFLIFTNQSKWFSFAAWR